MTADGCPWHKRALANPTAVVQLYDEDGRYLGLVTAEQACDGWHLNAFISAQLDALFAREAGPC